MNVCHAKAAQLQGQWSTDGFVEVEHYTTNACASVYPAKHCTDECKELEVVNLKNSVEFLQSYHQWWNFAGTSDI